MPSMATVCSICGREPDEHGLKSCPQCGREAVCCLCLLTTPDAWNAAFDSGAPVPAETWSCRKCVSKQPVSEHLRQAMAELRGLMRQMLEEALRAIQETLKEAKPDA